MRKSFYLKNLSPLRIAMVAVALCGTPFAIQASSSAIEQNAPAKGQQKISGTVKDEQGTPLPGVHIKIQGTTLGTITDYNGQFSLSLPNAGSQIEISFIGYQTQLFSAGGKSTLLVKLLPDTKKLDEVIVVGYGTRKAKDLTGNISTVSSRDFEKAPVTNAEALIANKISGVQVLPSSGKPGAGSSFLIQGGASLSATNNPLIVIDGLPIEGGNNGPGILSQLNPSDIENFTVLKDASASAIVLAHTEIEDKSNEIPAAQQMIRELGLTGVVFTADAMHCQKNLPDYA